MYERTFVTPVVDLGIATAGSSNTLTDTGKDWGINDLAGCKIFITGGKPQLRTVLSNTGTVITVDANWTNNPTADDEYFILSMTESSLAGSAVSASNAQIQQVIQTDDKVQLELIFKSTGGNFAAQNATIESSIDGVTYDTVDSVTLTSAQSKIAKEYDATHLGATLALNPMIFPYIRVTIPALGVGITGTIVYATK